MVADFSKADELSLEDLKKDHYRLEFLIAYEAAVLRLGESRWRVSRQYAVTVKYYPTPREAIDAAIGVLEYGLQEES